MILEVFLRYRSWPSPVISGLIFGSDLGTDVVVLSGAPPTRPNDISDEDNDCSDREMDADDLCDFED